jgi:soluble lytic murein transglycosylase
LIFLHLWDEAAFWLNESDTPLPKRAAAGISYLGGRYHRAISLADRLPRTDLTRPLVYPAGYHDVICNASATYKVDPLWIHAIVWQESKYDPTSRSGAAARGLMQFIPDTANAIGSSIGMTDLTLEKLFDPAVSIRLGAAYWAALMEKFKSPEQALAAYNGGPDNVERWAEKASDAELFVSDIGFVETKRYVMAVFTAHAAYVSLTNQ